MFPFHYSLDVNNHRSDKALNAICIFKVKIKGETNVETNEEINVEISLTRTLAKSISNNFTRITINDPTTSLMEINANNRIRLETVQKIKNSFESIQSNDSQGQEYSDDLSLNEAREYFEFGELIDSAVFKDPLRNNIDNLELDHENAIDVLQARVELNQQGDKEINYIAEHIMYCISNQAFVDWCKNVDNYDLLEKIIKNENLKSNLDQYDAILNFISSLIENPAQEIFVRLLSHIPLENCSDEALKEFWDRANNFQQDKFVEFSKVITSHLLKRSSSLNDQINDLTKNNAELETKNRELDLNNNNQNQTINNQNQTINEQREMINILADDIIHKEKEINDLKSELRNLEESTEHMIELPNFIFTAKSFICKNMEQIGKVFLLIITCIMMLQFMIMGARSKQISSCSDSSTTPDYSKNPQINYPNLSIHSNFTPLNSFLNHDYVNYKISFI